MPTTCFTSSRISCIIAMMTEDPTLPSAHPIDIRNAFVAPPVDDVEHAEQADGCIETVLTGFVCAEPIFDHRQESMSVEIRPCQKPRYHRLRYPLAVALPPLAPAAAGMPSCR